MGKPMYYEYFQASLWNIPRNAFGVNLCFFVIVNLDSGVGFGDVMHSSQEARTLLPTGF